MRFRCAIIGLLALAANGACAKKKHAPAPAAPASPVPAAVTVPAAAVPAAGTTPVAAGATAEAFRGARGRLAPEQFSALMRSAFQLERTVAIDSYGLQWDRVVEKYGVQLGGVDFEATFARDATPTAQMVLAARAVALETAFELVNRDHERASAASPPLVFNLCDLSADRPFAPEDEKLKPAKQEAIRAGEGRWRAQLDDLFWRLLSRAPTDDDAAAARAAFLDAWRREKGSERRGWVIVLYGLLSSAELWAL